MAPRLLYLPFVGTALTREAGTSLVEVVVALVIFILIVLALGNSVLGSRRTSETSRALAEATTLGLDKLEHLRTLLLVDSQVTAGSHVDSANPLRSDGTAGGAYTRSWTVTPNLPLVGMKRVEMSVSWTNRGKSSAVTLVTFLTLT